MKAFGDRPYRPALAAMAVLMVTAACGPKGLPPREVGSLSGPHGSETEVLEREEMTLAAISMEELIKDRIPNVLIRRAGSRAWIEIRGQGTITSNAEALIIVDGIQNTSQGLLSMNPADVLRIQALKGGSAAIYGMRAGNGVLIVTTRRQGQ